MKKLMLTCNCSPDEQGDRRAMFELAQGTFIPYAEKHGWDYKAAWYGDVDEQKWPGLIEGRLPTWFGHGSRTSPCWLKIPAVAEALERYDLVMYLDQDCVILDDSQDAENVLEHDKWLAMNDTFIGGPCVGFMIVRSCDFSKTFFKNMWFIDAWKSGTWTDNAQALSLLGYTTVAPVNWLGPTAFTPGFQRLPEPWGGVGMWPGGFPFKCAKVYHVAYHADPKWKFATMQRSLDAWKLKAMKGALRDWEAEP